MAAQLVDWLGNEALDFGDRLELKQKYKNNLFITITNRPFGKCYVLYICEEHEQDKAEQWLREFDSNLALTGIKGYGVGIQWGEEIANRRMTGFQGGAGYL